MIIQERLLNLTMSPDTIKMLAIKARAASTSLAQENEHPQNHDVEFDPERLEDRHGHDGLIEEERDNLTPDELTALLEDLNVDEAAELVALAWIGRGDYTKSEWDEALKAAYEHRDQNLSNYLIGMPMLATHLEDGLNTFNL